VTLQSDVETSDEKCKPRKEFCEEKMHRVRSLSDWMRREGEIYFEGSK
jgi:hypothetical protein